MHRIHIVGISPRTGTTLLAECMRSCFEIGLAEPHEVSLNRIRWCRSIYLTKKPDDVRYVGMRLAVDPRLSVICMVRDPRDTIMSRHGSRPDDYYAHLGRWKRHRAYVKRLRDHPRFVLVRYEDLVTDPDGVQALLVARIPCLKQTRAFSSFHRGTQVSGDASLALGGVRPIGADSVARWRSDLARLRGQIAEHGGIDEELIEYGYEKDTSWRDGLDGLSGVAGLVTVPPKPLGRHAVRAWVTRPLAAGLCCVCGVLGIPVG